MDFLSFLMIRDDVLKFTKQKKDEWNVFNTWESIQSSGSYLEAAFPVHKQLKGALYLPFHTTAMWVFPKLHLHLAVGNAIGALPILYLLNRLIQTELLDLFQKPLLTSLIDLFFWVILIASFSPATSLTEKSSTSKIYSLKFHFYCPFPAYIYWSLSDFFFLQLIFGRMIEFVGIYHIDLVL